MVSRRVLCATPSRQMSVVEIGRTMIDFCAERTGIQHDGSDRRFDVGRDGQIDRVTGKYCRVVLV